MPSYSFKRRSFLRGLGGAVGLKVMLRNLEAGAQGAKSPPRLLIAHWPVGTVRPDFIPTTGNTGSPILKPFGDAGLAGDTTVLLGLNTALIPSNGSGGHTGGILKLMTGVTIPGTRSGELQSDDGYAGGPSFDQIFLKNAGLLQRPGTGYANSICDSRVDFMESSARCLSYSYVTQPVAQALPTVTVGTQNVPLLPVLGPLAQWTSLFGAFVPGAGGGAGTSATMLKALRQRKSVLDLSLRQLARTKQLAPASEAAKIDIHTDAIRQIELQLAAQIQSQESAPTLSCTLPPMPAATAIGKGYDGLAHNDYPNPKAAQADDPAHAVVGKLHLDILKAAFVCDLIRVGTFQWAPGTSHVAFQGLYSADPTGSYMHNPMSHRINTSDTLVPNAAGRNPVVDFLSNVQTWYNTQMAASLAAWKTTLDGTGGNLFDNTVIPFLTEVSAAGHEQNNLPALLFGGKALGFQHGQYVNFSPPRPLNDLWLTIAQAFGLSAASTPLNAEKFVAEGNFTGPIDGLWVKPTT